MEREIQILVMIQLAIIGLSHILRPQIWVGFFTRLRELGESSAFAIAMPTLLFGSIIVSFHNVWSGIPLLLTLYGWALVLKAAVYLVAPKIGLAGLNRVAPERGRIFIVPGIFMLLLAALIAFHLARSVGT